MTAVFERLAAVRPRPVLAPQVGGRLVACDGLLLTVVGVDCAVGTVCAVGHARLVAEVIGFRDGRALLMGLGTGDGLVPGAAVIALAGARRAQAGRALIGRVIGGSGHPYDGGGQPSTGDHVELDPPPANPLAKRGVRVAFVTGIRVIDALLTLGRGQRVGIFAGSGVGKTVLLGQLLAGAEADVVIVALIGERGREIADFVATSLDAAARTRTIVIAVPASDPPLLRVRGAMRAHALAEYFGTRGHHVLLILDSLTRVAHAQREIGQALGEGLGARGYPPSAIALLPRLVERAGNDAASGGSVTAIYTVLADGDDMNDPVVDAARGVLDGHIVLSRAVAQAGIFPAIDIGASVSRVMHDIVGPEHRAAAAGFRRLHRLAEENRDLVLMGAYAAGADPEVDRALALQPAMVAFRTQRDPAPRDLSAAVAGLEAALA